MEWRNPRSIVMVMLVLALAACASAPSTAPQAVAVSEKTPATAALASDGKPVPPGYKRTVRNGEEYFCQTRTMTGSRARSAEVCMTRDQIRRMQEASDQYQKDAQNAGSQSRLELDSPN